MKFNKYSLFFFLTLSISCNIYAWSAMGHVVVAQIAYSNLQPQTKQRVSILLKHLSKEGEPNAFIYGSLWADRVKGHEFSIFNHWHYYNRPFTNDDSPLIKSDRHNIIWALKRLRLIMNSKKATEAEKAWALRFYIHLLADIHQPLHCATNVSHAHPYGDMGGNLFKIDDKRYRNLHRFWDGGLGEFKSYSLHRKSIRRLARLVRKHYPRQKFAKLIEVTNPTIWGRESFHLAENVAYQIPENTKPSKHYLEDGQAIVESQLALAGYRLAYVLNHTAL